MKTNYQELLKKYIKYVSTIRGTSLLHGDKEISLIHMLIRAEDFKETFTVEEQRILKEISSKIK